MGIKFIIYIYKGQIKNNIIKTSKGEAVNSLFEIKEISNNKLTASLNWEVQGNRILDVQKRSFFCFCWLSSHRSTSHSGARTPKSVSKHVNSYRDQNVQKFALQAVDHSLLKYQIVEDFFSDPPFHFSLYICPRNKLLWVGVYILDRKRKKRHQFTKMSLFSNKFLVMRVLLIRVLGENNLRLKNSKIVS